MADLTKNSPITDNGVYHFSLEGSRAIWVKVKVGRKQDSFGGGSIKLEQDGFTPSGLSAVTDQTQKVVCMDPGKGTITLTGATSPSVHVDFLEVAV